MSFQELVVSAQEYFPKLKIKFKDQSWFMKTLGKIMFFNPGFMTTYTTTIGDTVYFPNINYIKLHSVSSSVVLLHELVHMYDQKKVSKPLFAISYLFPQILSPICLFLLFLITWKIVVPLSLLFLLPIPAVFRMYWEKRAYISSLYTIELLSKRLKFDPHLDVHEKGFIEQFKNSFYYYMWPIFNLNKEFDAALVKAQVGQRPYQDAVFDMLDDLVTKV